MMRRRIARVAALCALSCSEPHANDAPVTPPVSVPAATESASSSAPSGSSSNPTPTPPAVSMPPPATATSSTVSSNPEGAPSVSTSNSAAPSGLPGTGGIGGTGGTQGNSTGGTSVTPDPGTAGTGGIPAVGSAGAAGAEPGVETPGGEEQRISFGTTLDASAVKAAAQALAAAEVDPNSPQWRATGDQHRTYQFEGTGRQEPYRLYVPTAWDGQTELPLVMFLHGAGSDENSYVDQNGQQMLTLAQQHGFLLVAPLGADGAYGNFLRLSAPFGNPAGAAELMAAVTPESERSNELSEQDVLNVLELVLHEYPIDPARRFLAGHSMGSGGTWYIGGKYAEYWRALAPMSGPFVQETGYPWDAVRALSLLVTEGTQTPSLEASLLLADWLTQNDFDAQYLEVNADHGQMVSLVLPDVFEFFANAQ